MPETKKYSFPGSQDISSDSDWRKNAKYLLPETKKYGFNGRQDVSADASNIKSFYLFSDVQDVYQIQKI